MSKESEGITPLKKHEEEVTIDKFNEMRAELEKRGYIYNFIDGEGAPENKDAGGDLDSYISKEKLLEKFRERGGRYVDSRDLILECYKTEEEKLKFIREQIESIFNTLYSHDIGDDTSYIKSVIEVKRFFETTTRHNGWGLEERARVDFILEEEFCRKEGEENE